MRIGQRPLTCSVRTGPPECSVEAGRAGFPRVNEWGDGRKPQVIRLLFQEVKQQERWCEEVNLRDLFIKMEVISTGLMAKQKEPAEPENEERETWEEDDCQSLAPGEWKGIPSKTSTRDFPGGFPGGSDGKGSVCNARDPGSIPGSGRSPGEGKGNPFQHSCLENPMDRGAW